MNGFPFDLNYLQSDTSECVYASVCGCWQLFPAGRVGVVGLRHAKINNSINCRGELNPIIREED